MLRFVAPFTAERVGTYERSDRLDAGEYHLTLAQASPRADEISSRIQLLARLDP